MNLVVALETQPALTPESAGATVAVAANRPGLRVRRAKKTTAQAAPSAIAGARLLA